MEKLEKFLILAKEISSKDFSTLQEYETSYYKVLLPWRGLVLSVHWQSKGIDFA